MGELKFDPTPEQVEAAAVAFTCETQDEWERSPDAYKEMIREDMRAALVAAAGAAPRETSQCSGNDRCRARPHEHGCFADTGDCEEPGEHAAPTRAGERSTLIDQLRKDAGDYADHVRGIPKSHQLDWDARNYRAWQAAELLAAPVQVDEAKLEEVILDTIRASWTFWENRTQQSEDIAHAVAEWLRGGTQ